MRQYRGQAEAFYDDGDIPFSIEQFINTMRKMVIMFLNVKSL
ncbi:hypothetical protein [Gilliamella sp. ESL0441]|nr:hypothetical protein [Gilliamella sp. ESL0441]